MRSVVLASLLVAAVSASACSACEKGGPGAPPGASSAAYVNRTLPPSPEAGPAAMRDVVIWANAKSGTTEDLASLATYEGGAGLVEAASETALRPTALRAMGYARGWAQLPYLASVATAKDDEEARLALESVSELAARKRLAEDAEDADELREGCEKLGTLTRGADGEKWRRVSALKSLRMLPCPKQDLPVDLDAK